MRLLSFILAVVFLLHATAFGEIVEVDSLDWMLNDCDVAFVGDIVALHKVTDAKDGQFEVVTVASTKVYRGKIPERVVFVLHNFNGTRIANRWKRNALPMLFFLKQTSKLQPAPEVFTKYRYHLRHDGNDFSCVTLGKSKFHWTRDSHAVTKDCRILKVPTEITDYLASVPLIDRKHLHMNRKKRRPNQTHTSAFGLEARCTCECRVQNTFQSVSPYRHHRNESLRKEACISRIHIAYERLLNKVVEADELLV